MTSRCNHVLLLLLILLVAWPSAHAARTEVAFPEITGYLTLKCDFHMHTVFSDGSVWPDVRVKEAWRNGLDAIAITDHIEYLPHKDDIKKDFNRSHEIAKGVAAEHHILLVPGAEITRAEPQGHFNALFLTDANALEVEDDKEAVRIAAEQGAFLFWNHPGWKQPDRRAVWGEVHEEFFTKGWMHGLEAYNGRSYFPNTHGWCLEKKLTLLSNTNVHAPIDESYDYHAGEHRTMTLVFAKERTLPAIKEALFARRTVAYSGDTLAGEEQWVRPLFESSVTAAYTGATLKGKGRHRVLIHNACDAPFNLVANGKIDGLTFPGNLTIPAGKSEFLTLQGTGAAASGLKKITLPYKVENVLTAPGKPLEVSFDLEVEFVKE